MDAHLKAEIEHGKWIAPHAPFVWGWGTRAGRLRWKRRAAFFLNRIKPGMRILEVGCGVGNLSKQVKDAGAFIVSVDISAELLKEAQKTKCGCHYVLQDVQRLGFVRGIFDLVIGNSILHHAEFKRALTEIYGVLKPGGCICFFEPNMLNPQIMFQKNIPFFKRLAGDTPHETAFFRWRLSGDLKAMGFKEIYVGNWDFLHPGIPSCLVSGADWAGKFLEKTPILKEFSGSLSVEARK